ncbi:MAG TPA: hypothetical protein VE079_12225 [Ensifer sp.]|nr:hypothetical protein [Ensifer sp.]
MWQIVWDYLQRSSNEIISSVVVSAFSALAVGSISKAVRHGTYKPMLCKFKAMKVKSRKLRSFSVLVCEFEGDNKGRLSRVIRASLATNYPVEPDRPHSLLVVKFPLSLPALGEDEEDEKRNERKARHWLREADCDVIVWGERLNESGLSIIKTIGNKNSQSQLIELTPSVKSDAFYSVVAEAITREVIEAQTEAFERPESIALDQLRRIAQRQRQLLASNLAGFTVGTAQRVRGSLDVLLTEMSVRTSSVADWDAALDNSRRWLLESNEFGDMRAVCNAAVRFGDHLRRRAWAGMDLRELQSDVDLLKSAMVSIRGSGLSDNCVDNIFVNINFLNAIRNRDYKGEPKEIDAPGCLEIYNTATDGGLRLLCAAFLISYDPFLILRGSLSKIKKGWIEKVWCTFDCESMPSDLQASVLDSLVEEQFSAATDSADKILYEDLISFLLRHEASGRNCLRLFWLTTFAEATSITARRFGYSFFFERFPSLDIFGVLGAASGELFALSATFERALYLQCSALRVAGSAAAGCGSFTGAVMDFRSADTAYLRLQNLTAQHFPWRLQNVVFERCSSLNTWSRRHRDLDTVERSLSLLADVGANANSFGCYLLAFAHATKAAIFLERQAFELAEIEARTSLSLCAKARSLPNERGRHGIEVLAKTSKEVRELLDSTLAHKREET